MQRFFVGITGASGHAYAEALVRALVRAGRRVDLAVTSAGAKVLRHELGVATGAGGTLAPEALDAWLGEGTSASVRSFAVDAVEAPPSSGTSLTGGAILCPCSMGTLARIAVGLSSNLVERAADVALKEGRPLLVVPREAPLSEIHLENMLRLARRVAIVVPASPGFYHRPRTLGDLVDHVVGKILDRLGVDNAVGARWQGLDEPAAEAGIGGPPPPDPLLAPPAGDATRPAGTGEG